ncbi:hypothetical protein O988_05681 [Pseudogymnoascus sp. VKM F-3808]|nr:hypothetical protein O988_05681 [Pseudogymnoascus sp. VKM F-3808]
MAGIEKLTGRTNYRVWSLQMKRLLQSRGLWDIVEPLPQSEQVPKSKPGETSATHKDAPLGETPTAAPAPSPPTADFVIRDAKASCLIMEHCGPAPLDLIAATECARRQWAILRDLYIPSMRAVRQLEQRFENLAEYAGRIRFAQIGAELEGLQKEIGDCGGMRPTDNDKMRVLREVVRGREYKYWLYVSEMEEKGICEFDAMLEKLVRYEWAAEGREAEAEDFTAATAPSPRGRGRGGRKRGGGRGGRGGRGGQ